MTKQQFKQAIEDNTVLSLLNKVYVKKGDYFLIEAGTLHAIGAGIMICEIQQNSNSTYRVYDYNRKDKNGCLRELHIDKAVDVTNLHPILKGQSGNVEKKNTLMVDCPLFNCSYYCINEHETIEFDCDSFKAIIFLEGKGNIAGNGESQAFNKGDSFLLRARLKEIEVCGNCELILVK